MTASSHETQKLSTPQPENDQAASAPDTSSISTDSSTKELGGPKGPEPTRFGDWERKGRCVDF